MIFDLVIFEKDLIFVGLPCKILAKITVPLLDSPFKFRGKKGSIVRE